MDKIQDVIKGINIFDEISNFYNNKFLLNACGAAIDENKEKEKYTDCIQDSLIVSANNTDNLIFKQQMIDIIRKDIINGKINLTNIAIGKEDYLIIKENDIIYQITTSNNQKNNEYDNISTIDLGDCEKILKDKYKIDDNLPLIIYKVDYSKEGLLIPVIGYEIYHPLNNSILDLNYCDKEKVEVNIPVTINEKKIIYT